MRTVTIEMLGVQASETTLFIRGKRKTGGEIVKNKIRGNNLV